MLKINYVPNEPFRHVVRQCTYFPFSRTLCNTNEAGSFMVPIFLSTVFLLHLYFFALMVDGKKYSTFSATRKASLVQPISQSTYKGRAEIEGVYLHSQLEHTPQLCM
jgi:hypothetical protein